MDRRDDHLVFLIPVHRKLYQLLIAGKLKECAKVLAQHLEDSESRLSRIMGSHKQAGSATVAISTPKIA